MAYNLPPPWDSGYALPQNVKDEGIQRQAFVTKQLPRGTYDDPNVGDGGYTVPQYVKDEGYGQGTFTTKWLPNGTYPGRKIPHWLNQRPQVVSDMAMPSSAPAPVDDGTDPTMTSGAPPSVVTIATSAPTPAGSPATNALSGFDASSILPLAAGAAVLWFLLRKKK